MEANFNFKSQICTDKVQSERLLALGLKKETADMYLCPSVDGTIYQVVQLPESSFAEDEIPAWSLGRLIEMIKKSDYLHYNDMGCIKLYLEQDDFDTVMTIISIMVKEGYFNEEYLT